MTEKEEEILHKAIAVYGKMPQIDMIIEEMSELTKALCKYKRAYYKLGKYANEPTMPVDIYDNVCEEIADVKIMIRQMEMIFGESNVEAEMREKIERLERNLNDE